VCIIDQAQNLFAHPDHGKAVGLDAEFVIKIRPAFGVVLVIATQRPDKASLPTRVSGNVSTRFCLKVTGQAENDMILGTSAYKNGLRSTTLRPEIDAGIGYLVGGGPAPQVVRTFYLNMADTEWADLAGRLASRFLARWEGAAADSISAECRHRGVASVNVKARGEIARGCRRADVEALAGARPA
jgi:hypothetical protein